MQLPVSSAKPKGQSAQFRARRRYTDADVVGEIERLALQGRHSPTAIHGQLAHDARFAARTPSLRTVQNIVRESTPPPGDPWRFADADATDAALVLPVLKAIVRRTGGLVRGVSRDEAEWIIKIRRAAPDTPAWASYLIARLYAAQRKGADTTSLDLLLICEPWTPGGGEQYQRLRAERWMPGVQVGPGFLAELAEGGMD